MSRQSTKNKKYALRKIGKVFGSCVVATVITLGVAVTLPSNNVYANENASGPSKVIDASSGAAEGYEVFIPKGKVYVRNDDIESHVPKLKEKGYNGRSFILKAEPKDDDPELTENKISDYFSDNPMEGLFEKLYDEDEDGVIDDKYKRADADTINEHAGEELPDGSSFKEPRISEVDPKYPHRLDAGVLNPARDDMNKDGKPDGADGEINDDDAIVVSKKPITVNPELEENRVNEDGTVELTKYYNIHVNEGEHAEKKDDVYEVGTKPKVEKTPIPFETRYERDDSVPEGTEEVVTAGVDGETVKTTTYELNPTTGEVTANEPKTTTTNPVTKVVKRGTQPKVEKTPIPFETRYERDDSVPEGTEEVVTAGVDGETVKTTTYELNPTTGEVTANEPKTTTTNPVTKVVKRGTQPKVEEKPTDKPTEGTPSGDKPTEGTPSGDKPTEGTPSGDKPAEGTPSGDKPTEGTPSGDKPTEGTPSGDKPTEGAPSGDKPTDKPEKPSGTEDQPDLKVAPPTIAIVEEPNKASIEVKAPKKDADTVRITYPKSDGSGEEVLTLTKQPTGEWTLDKQPENVTLEKKTGTVTIPRESVVNKEKVQAQAKHKTSGFTPFVYAALSIEAANPEFPVTLWVDKARTELKERVVGKKVEAGEIPGYKWLSSRLEEGILTHTFEKVANGTPSQPERPSEPEDQPNLKVAPPTIAIIEEPNKASIEVKAPKKDADTVKITYPKSDGSGNEVLTLTKQPTGEWTLDKQPENVTLEKKTGTVTIPRESVVNKEKVQAQSKHKTSDYTPFVYAALSIAEANPEYPVTVWVDRAGTEIKKRVEGQKVEAGEIPGYKWLSSRLENGILTHTFEKVTNGTPSQPGQPSEPEDQPNLKVAPPTIAIVEEPNKASIEVKAPKKDADTVKITYPKSDGSGNEVLTLTKQPTGEWTLDKQPENVTLDKKTGTVTIPRESVVNKEKVQAQAKHKTSGYTPFVSAALSIGEANPEYPVTLWVDRAGTEIKERVEGQKVEAGEIPGYKWLSSRLEEGILTHTFEKVTNGTPTSPSSPSHPRTPSSSPSTSTPEKPNKAETPAVRTVWRDENGKDLKVPSVDKQEAGEVEGYEFVESHREGDDLIVHVFRSKQAQTPAPKDQTPSPEQAPSPAPSKVSEQKGEAVATATSEKTVDSATSTKTSDKAELPNTGTEANASLASAGIMTLLAGLGLGFFKKKEDEK